MQDSGKNKEAIIDKVQETETAQIGAVFLGLIFIELFG
jgi:hypothetical protein